jgi:hypothetical protein
MGFIVFVVIIIALIVALSIRKHAFYKRAVASVSGIRLVVMPGGDLMRRSTFLVHQRVGKVTGVELSKAGAVSTTLSFTFADRGPYTYSIRGGQTQGIALRDQVRYYLSRQS